MVGKRRKRALIRYITLGAPEDHAQRGFTLKCHCQACHCGGGTPLLGCRFLSFPSLVVRFKSFDSFAAGMSDSPPTTSAVHPSLETMVHPVGITIDTVGIEADNRDASCRHYNRYCRKWDNRGRSCEEHDVCGSVLEENAVVRIRHV